MNSRKTLCILCIIIALGAPLSAQMPDWFLNPPMDENRIFGIGTGSTEFEALVQAISDIAFQAGTSIDTFEMNGEYVFSFQKTTWQGPHYMIHSIASDSPALGYSGSLFLEVRDGQTDRSGSFMWRTFQEELSLEHAGLIDEDEALSLLKRNPATWKDEQHPCIEVLEIVRDRKSNKPLYYALIAIKTPEDTLPEGAFDGFKADEALKSPE